MLGNIGKVLKKTTLRLKLANMQKLLPSSRISSFIGNYYVFGNFIRKDRSKYGGGPSPLEGKTYELVARTESVRHP
jgi:hypothetical protein